MVTSVNAPPSPLVLSASPITCSYSPPSPCTFLLAKPIKFSVSHRPDFRRMLQSNFRVKSSIKDVDSEKTKSLPTDEPKSKSDAVGNTTSVLIYGGGVLFALWLSSTIVRSVNSVPLLPKLLEIFGLAYTAWFAYRYLLFKENRKELVADIKELTSKITGTE